MRIRQSKRVIPSRKQISQAMKSKRSSQPMSGIEYDSFGKCNSMSGMGDLVSVAPPTLKWGSSGADVTYLQSSLNKLGYVAGSADGKFGDTTFYAVKKFQQAEGLTSDGIVGSRTWGLLAARLSEIGQKTVAPSAAPVSSPIVLTSSSTLSSTLSTTKGTLSKLSIPSGFFKSKKFLIGGALGLLAVISSLVLMGDGSETSGVPARSEKV
jgi:hypothetical protein